MKIAFQLGSVEAYLSFGQTRRRIIQQPRGNRMTDREIIQRAYEQEAMELFSACAQDYTGTGKGNPLGRFENGVRLLQKFRDAVLSRMPKEKST